jgi:hypothetical protein
MDERTEDGKFRAFRGLGRPVEADTSAEKKKAKKEFLAWIKEISPTGRFGDLDSLTATRLKRAQKLLERILILEGKEFSDNKTELILRASRQLENILKALRKEALEDE